jgi:hypothetical protein
LKEFKGGRKMKKLVKVLIDNYDFESMEDFQEQAKSNREEIVKWLQWRADGGKMKNEITAAGLAQACKELLNRI